MSDDLLRKQLEGVTPVAPAGNEDDHEESDEELEPDPEATDGDEEGDEGGDGKGSGRPEENWYREMIRKQAEFNERLEQRQSAFEERFVQVMENFRGEPVKDSGDPLASKSIPELRALLKNPELSDDVKDQLGEYITGRLVDEKVRERTEVSQATNARKAANQEAVNRYPQLMDTNSKFRAKVQAKLNALGKSYVDGNPRALLDAANDVAVETGTSFRPTGPKVTKPKPAPSNRQTGAPVKSGKKKGVSPELAKIGARLSAALPPGQKFDMDTIQERTDEYAENINLFVRE